MLDYLWAAMIMIGIIVAAFCGNLEAVSEGIINSAKEGIELVITMAGVVGMWSGFLRIAEQSGLIRRITERLKPLLSLIFPRLPSDSEAYGYICENFVANFLGLSWACTPTGIRAIRSLVERERKLGNDVTVASDEMCTFLLLNLSSLQLIPMNMIVFRSQYGSVNPTRIVGPALLATTINTVITFFICRVICEVRAGKAGGRC